MVNWDQLKQRRDAQRGHYHSNCEVLQLAHMPSRYCGGGAKGGLLPQCGLAGGQKTGTGCEASNTAHAKMAAPISSMVALNTTTSPFHIVRWCR
jgi:hypothetical protein